MQHALIWFLVVQLVGLLALPLAYSLFRRLPDRGFTLAIPLGLLLGSYLFWVAGLTHVLPNSRYTIIGVLTLLALASGLLLRRNWSGLWSFLRENWVPLLTAKLVFIGLYSFWLSMLSLSPAINHTEMPMDFAFLNSILRSEHFPPEDPWLAGHSVNYYYFGHFVMAFLTKLTSIPSNVSYNLSIALVSAIAGVAVFGLVYNLIRLSGARIRTAVLFGLTGPLFLGLIGNLEGVFEFVYSAGWGSDGFWQWVSIKGLESAPSGDFSFFPDKHWWWWQATRVIDTLVDGASRDYTITEFPFFSFYLADLHPHVSALPFIALVLGLGLNLFVSNEKLGFAWLRKYPLEALAIALALGSLSFINTWDFPLVITIFAALLLAKAYADSEGPLPRSLLPSLSVLALILTGAVILFLPFYATMERGEVSGILPLGEVSTRPLFFFIIWGLFSFLGGSFLIKQVWTVPGLTGKTPGLFALVATITLAPFLIWGTIELFFLWTGWDILFDRLGGGAIDNATTVGKRFVLILPGMAIAGVGLYSMLLRTRHGGERATAFSLLVLAMAFYLLVGAELFYVVDIFGNRMNTVFKFYYEAWLLLAVASAYGLYYLYSRPIPKISGFLPVVARSFGTRLQVPAGILRKGTVYVWVALVAVLLLVSIYYPVAAVLTRTDQGGTSPTLDGLAFLDKSASGEYEAILWLRDEAPRGRIVEAVKDPNDPPGPISPLDYGRISASTGLPTMLGWKGHQRQWRGRRIDALLDEREQQVTQIYTSDDPNIVKGLLEAHDIRYVYLGRRERREYGIQNFDDFSTILRPVFQAEDVVIYERQRPGDEA